MKNFLPLFIGAATALPCVAQNAPAKSQILPGSYITSISSNGQWVTGQADLTGALYVKDLKTNKEYITEGVATVNDLGYTSGLGKTIADNGTTVALLNGIP